MKEKNKFRNLIKIGTNKIYLILVFRVILGALFVVAGISKITDLNKMQELVENFGILPYALIPTFSYILTILEIWVGFMLIFGIYIKAHSIILLIMLSIFSIAVSNSLIEGGSFNCGCFELIHQSKISINIIIRNFFLSIIALIIFYDDNHIFYFSE